MKANEIIRDSAKLAAKVESVVKAGKSFNHAVHVAAVSCILHIEAHGDVTLLNRLYNGMPGMARRNALIAYAENMGKVTFDTKEKAFKYDRSKETAEEAVMLAESPDQFAPEPEYKPFDLTAALAKLLKTADERAKKADPAKGDKIDTAVLAKLKAIAVEAATTA